MKGFVLSFDLTLTIEGKEERGVEAFSGGNNIFLTREMGNGIRICFAANSIKDYTVKNKVLHHILKEYAPRLKRCFVDNVTIDLESRLLLQQFVISRNIPEWLMKKYELVSTLEEETSQVLCMELEHVSGSHINDISEVDIDIIRTVTNKCLDVGIMPYDLRPANILKSDDKIIFLDFDEWTIVNYKLLQKFYDKL